MGKHHTGRFTVSGPLAKAEIEDRGELRFIHRRIAGDEQNAVRFQA